MKFQHDFKELRANEIVNHFMAQGATVSKNDYIYILGVLSEQSLAIGHYLIEGLNHYSHEASENRVDIEKSIEIISQITGATIN